MVAGQSETGDGDPPERGGGPRGVADVLGVAAGCAAVVVLLSSAWVDVVLPAERAQQLLALVAAAAGAGAGVLAGLGSRLTADRRLRRLAAALLGYGLVLLPWTTVVTGAGSAPTERIARLAAGVAVGLLLVLSVRPLGRLGVRRWAALLGVGGGLVVAAALWLPLGGVLPAEAAPGLPLAAGWAVAATGWMLDGIRRRQLSTLRVGLGLAVLAGAQLYGITLYGITLYGMTPHGVTGAGETVCGALGLLGLVIVLVGLARGAQQALGALHSLHGQQQDELVAAELHRARTSELAAERDHELRNGLAGLAGITHLLSADGHEHEPLKHAVLAELGRLHLILDGAVGDQEDPDHAEPAVDYEVEPVLSGLVMLRRSGGGRVLLRVERGLRARGHSALLAQVVTNLLANCDRHAPGAAITVVARRGERAVVITVRDDGPGLAEPLAGSVLERGVRDEAAGGSGLGLHISRQLIAREGGTLTLSDVDDPPGCLATVTVPLAGAEQSAGTGPATTPSTR